MELLQAKVKIQTLDDLDLCYWFDQGIRGVLIDLDNTIAPWRQTAITDEACRLLQRSAALGINVLLFTNAGERRAQAAAATAGIGYISRARKPFASGYRRALSKLNLPAQAVLSIGDQIFTDILGGNRAGCVSVLVPPLDVQEYGGTKILRFLERLVGREQAYRQREGI